MKCCVINYQDNLYAVQIKKKKQFRVVVVYEYFPLKWFRKYQDGESYIELLLLEIAGMKRKNLNPASKDYLYKLAKFAVTVYTSDMQHGIGKKQSAEMEAIEANFSNERRQECHYKELIAEQYNNWNDWLQKGKIYE